MLIPGRPAYLSVFMLFLCFFLTVLPFLRAGFVFRTEEKDRYFASLRADVKLDARDLVIPSAGLKFRPFVNGYLLPPEAPRVHFFTDPETGKRLPGFFPDDLWRFDQIAAQWAGNGMEIHIATPTLPVQDDPVLIGGGKYQTWEAYREWKNSVLREKQEPSPLPRWARHMFGISVSEEGETVRSTQFFELKRHKVEDPEESGRLAFYVFTRRDNSFRVVILFHTGDIADAGKGIQSLLNTLQTYPLDKNAIPRPEPGTGTGAGRDADSQAPQTPTASSSVPATSAAELGRIHALRTIEKLPSWWSLEGRNILLLSDSKKRRDISSVRDEADKTFAVLKQIFRSDEALEFPLLIRLFDSRAEYLRYVGPERDGRMIWNSSRKEIDSSPLSFFDSGKRTEQFFSDLHGNMTRQYLALSFRLKNAMPWFQEGSIGVFTGLDIRSGGKVSVNPPAARMDSWGKHAISSEYGDVRTLISTKYRNFWDRKGRALSASKALMYYLYFGAPVQKKVSYAEIPYKYFLAMLQTGNPELANEIAWKGIDKEQFNKDWHDFWENKTALSKAKVYDPLSGLEEIYSRLPKRFLLPERKK